ncbi:copper amine oxidase N-terminal domain-containing protein [Paenibacillus thermotolerans]|uniref:copper amine oxidase N-terminal domain-containing protein n=1 Tax=Paenibacillus thermotolerans TaxID=3027807 RepID=UPI0023687C6B|nr:MULTISPECIES: copper amine oxidase N-terminal domain-containing protein [unclassified Paenibacillus]
MKSAIVSATIAMLLSMSAFLTPTASGTVAADKTPVVFLNGLKMELEIPSISIEGHTLVPMRSLFESLGAQLEWEASTRTATAIKDFTIIQYKIGASFAMMNGESKKLPVPGRIIDGAAVVPLRFFSEALGASVIWDGKSRTIAINTAKPAADNKNWTARSDLDGDGVEELLFAREVLTDTDAKYVLGVYQRNDSKWVLKSETEIFKPLLYLLIESADIITGSGKEIFVTDAGEYPSYALYEWTGDRLVAVDLKESGIESAPQQVGVFNEEGLTGLYFSHRISAALWQSDLYIWNGSKFELFDQRRLSEQF